MFPYILLNLYHVGKWFSNEAWILNNVYGLYYEN